MTENVDEGIESRKNYRPAPPPPALRVKVDIVLDTMARSTGMAWGIRIGFILLIILILGIGWWEVTHRAPILSVNAELVQAMAKTDTEITLQKKRLNPKAVNIAKIKIANHNSSFFPSDEVVLHWLIALINKADNSGIKLRYQMGNSIPAPVSIGHKILSVSIQLETLKKKKNRSVTSNYERLIDFTIKQIKSQYHVDVVSAVMDGNGKNALHLRLILNLWLQK